MKIILSRILIILTLGLPLAGTASEKGLLPFDGRWLYPHYLTFRPGNGQLSDVNPPRLSWPYLPGVITEKTRVPSQEFVLQLSRSKDFLNPEIEVHTPYNFYSALPILEPGQWYWRVGYSVGSDEEQWSVVRSFGFSEDVVNWDRQVIDEVAELLAQRPHPRLVPPNGDWQQWYQKLQGSPEHAVFLEALFAEVQAAMDSDWWDDFPQSDLRGENPYNYNEWMEMGRMIAAASFAYRLTGDPKYARSKDLALAMAKFSKGGMSSPEFHGAQGTRPTRITEYLALSYDWWYAELAEKERQILLDAIKWRLDAIFLGRLSWANAENGMMWRTGVSMHTRSHPFENFMVGTPAVLLTAGDLPLADELLPLCLNYLTAVGSTLGPDGGYNEGYSYGLSKTGHMIDTSIYTALLLPELKIEKNPYYTGLGEWFSHLLPIGVKHLSFSDYAYSVDSAGKRARHSITLRYLSWLSSEGSFARRADLLKPSKEPITSDKPWLELLGAANLSEPEAQPETVTTRVFPESGWVMASSKTPSDVEGFKDATGMIFISRPRGGYSHSYRADNSFVWYSHGQTLSSGGGTTFYADLHSRNSMSHNVVLINGLGQQWHKREEHPSTLGTLLISPREADPLYPFVARLIAWEQGDGFVHWVGDATHAYQSVPELLRWHRHVVFVENKWFVIFDDLAVHPDADPATFSWLFHVRPDVPLEIAENEKSFSYVMNGVRAQVALADDNDELEIVNLQGLDGYINPILGENVYEPTMERLGRLNRAPDARFIVAHNLWVSNRKPAHEWTFLSVLTASDAGEENAAQVSFNGGTVVTISDGETSRTISFDPDTPGDIEINLKAIREHALATDPGRLPLSGSQETVVVGDDKYVVDRLLEEDLNDPFWASRWVVEGNSVVSAAEGELLVQRSSLDKPQAATVWLRPELPQNVFIRFRVRVPESKESDAANVNLFLHAREPDGSPLRFERSGADGSYQAVPSYKLTLSNEGGKAGSQILRNPNLEALSESTQHLEQGQEYEVTLSLIDGRMRYYIDGKKIHDIQVKDPLLAGRLGLNTFDSDVCWKDIEVGRILSEF